VNSSKLQHSECFALLRRTNIGVGLIRCALGIAMPVYSLQYEIREQ